MKRKKSGARKKPAHKKKSPKAGPSVEPQQVLAAAIEHHQKGRLGQAEAGYRQILHSDPDHADANHLLGVIAYQTGNLEIAEQLISKALQTDPQQPQMHSNLGNVLQDQGRAEQAIEHYQKALAINPDFPEGLNNLGNAQKTCGQFEQAVGSFKKAIALRPEYAEANNNLGNTLKELGQNEQAITYLRQAIALNPSYADAHHNLARALFDSDQLEQAAESCQQAIALKDDFVDARVNLSVIYQKMGRKQESLDAAKQTVMLAPQSSSARTALANMLLEQGLHEEAQTSYAQALELDPDNEEAHSNNLMTMHYAMSTTNQDLFDTATRWAEPYNEGIPQQQFANTPDANRKIRIGYVSGDLSKHPVGFYLSGILPFHNGDLVEVVCYSNAHKSDEVTQTLRASSALWRDVSNLSDDAMVDQIKRDSIDILVDLSGHTLGNRLAVFAEAPAPVQVTWMGYTGTTGLTSIDYILADHCVVSEAEQHLYSESVKYLPGCYLCFDPPKYDIACAPPPALQSGIVTFGSFNNRVKITAQTIATWAQILNTVANSQLLLKTPLLDDQGIKGSLIQQFQAHGIDPDRLLLEGRASRADLLAAYQRIDIALDTLPFGGGVTTAEATWMGIPVISLSSPRWSGRLGQTILKAMDMPELIATDPAHYRQLAIDLGTDLPRLEQIRSGLRDKMLASPFCDGPAFAAKLDNAFREMWTHWCAQQQALLPSQADTPSQQATPSADIPQDYAKAIDHHQHGRVGEAAGFYQSILQADPNHIASMQNLGVILNGQGEHQQAIELFQKAIELKPDYARAHESMGIALFDMGQMEAAEASFMAALRIDANLTTTHFNLGVLYKETHRFDDALGSLGKLIEINPHDKHAWTDYGLTMKLAFSGRGLKKTNAAHPTSNLPPEIQSSRYFALYQYALDAYRPHQADASYDKVMNLTRAELAAPSTSGTLPGHTVALLHFGRSGTGFMHSLIDNHPEISTIPSIYLSGFFNHGIWQHLASGDPAQMPERFVEAFEVMFDATSPKPIPGPGQDEFPMIGFKEGMTALGENRDEILKVDARAFCDKARDLMAISGSIEAGGFLRIVHAAYEHALGTKTHRRTIFYHIHNPDQYASFNFLGNMPDARLLMMIRNPVQSLESWLRNPLKKNDYTVFSQRVIDMLFNMDRVAFRKQDSVGVRLEDLKSHPEATMGAVCKWIGIEDNPCLYEMTAQGKKWWGDPSSPHYDSTKDIPPFDAASVNSPAGTVLGERDRLVMETLFHPFSVLFGYRQDDQNTFKRNLKETRHILEGLLECEQNIIDQTGLDQKEFQQNIKYQLLRASITDRLEVLEELGTYPHMLKPLDIN